MKTVNKFSVSQILKFECVEKSTQTICVKMIPAKGGQGGSLQPDFNTSKVLSKENFEIFVKEVLDAHNKYRKMHGVQPLELKKELNKYSQNWAEKLAKKDTMEHSNKKDRPNIGENIYWASTKYVPGNLPVDSWYSEAVSENYKYGIEPKGLSAGHFTQVVWKNSKYLGVGAKASSKGLFIVCNYEPSGNIVGKFTENVKAPT